MLKVLINEEEVLTNKDFTIKKEMLNTPSVILNNVYPKTWEDEKDYTSNFYHPQDYSKCKIIDESIVPADPGETITGTSFTILDNDNTKLNELTEIEGNTTQAGTPTPSSPQPINVVSGRQEVYDVGKNWFNYATTETYTTSVNGAYLLQKGIDTNYIDVSQQNNGYYVNNYVNTGYRWFSMKVNLSKNTNFKFLCGDTNITVLTNIRLYGFNTLANGTTGTQISALKNGTTFNTGDYEYYLLAIYPHQQGTYIKDIQIIKSDIEDTTYEAYTGQSYEINLGKNLLRFSNDTNTRRNQFTYITETPELVVCNKNESGSNFYAKYEIYIEQGQKYILSVEDTSAKTFYGYSDDLWGTAVSGLANQNVSKSVPFKFTASYTGNLVIGFYGNYNYNPLTLTKPMIEKGTQATSYSPYKTPIELCKIGNYQDKIAKSTGKNLFDEDNVISNAIIQTRTRRVTWTNEATTIWLKVQPNTQYTMSRDRGNRLIIGASNNQPVLEGTLDTIIYDGGTSEATSYTFNSGNYTYIAIYISRNTSTTPNWVMVNEGTTALPYEPYNSKGKWYLHKEIGKVVLNGSELWQGSNNYFFSTAIDNYALWNSYQNYSNYFKSYNKRMTPSTVVSEDSLSVGGSNATDGLKIRIKLVSMSISTANDFKTWLSTHNTIVYYVLKTPTTTEITDSELISQLNSIELLEGLNNVSVSSGYLPGEITIHYNYTEEQTIDDLLFCGVVKNSGNISLNPREPHFQSLQILDFKTFLSEGELDSFVIYQKTILEAIQMVIANIQDYGFILGNVNILNPTDVIGAYSTKDKTAYDVFNYIADITQSRWTTRLIDENHVAIDFYDPTLMVEGTPINYTQTFFENNLIDDMTYSYGSNNYRNKQVMTSSQVYSNISQQQSIVANGYQTQFPTEQPIGKINSITSNGIPLTFATFNEKKMGYVADFYYSPGENYFESEDLRTTGEILIIDYVAIVEGRQIITNPLEIDRINDSTGRKGIISRYEQRNDATTSTELQKIGESYIKYKGTPEIKLKISTRKNIWEVGQRVQFNAPIEDLDTEYMVRTKKINYISTIDTIFYEYELISSFNSETEINYFDNQRAKASGNIGEGEYISRNIDIESTANIIFYDTETTEVQVDGDNVLNSILNSPFIS